MPASFIRAHARRAIPPVALGTERKSLGLTYFMRTARSCGI